MIKCDGVSFNYHENKALDDVNFKINKNEFVAIMGDNGCGKSTLLKILNGLLFPFRGSYVLDENEITKEYLEDNCNVKLFHQKIGFIFQNHDVQLFNVTVYDEIAFGPRTMGLGEEEIDRRVKDCLKLLNIEDLKMRVPYHLSGGEKKKIAIASVLSMNPKIMVLDEPFNGLSMHCQEEILLLLVRLNKIGKTIILTTHRYDQIKNVANHFLIFKDNNIKYDLSKEELSKRKDIENFCKTL